MRPESSAAAAAAAAAHAWLALSRKGMENAEGTCCWTTEVAQGKHHCMGRPIGTTIYLTA
eukprot:1153231-Pelagomonas_calceolata.AAC.3